MKNKNQFIKDILLVIKNQSECRSRSVGAIIVRNDKIIAEGWNSPPRKCDHSDCIKCNVGDITGKRDGPSLCIHAEINAICAAAYNGIAIKDTILYCTLKPCSDCAKAISASGICEVYYFETYYSEYTDLIFKQAKIQHKLI